MPLSGRRVADTRLGRLAGVRTRRDHRIYPIVFEDGFRSSIATGAALLVVLPWLIPLFSVAEHGGIDPADALAVLCAAWEMR